MSAPPPVAPPTMPTMVSRLPKFGSRPKHATLFAGAQTGPAAVSGGTRLTNGFYHHPGPAGVDGGPTATAAASVKQNGFIRVPTTFSMKWRRESEPAEDEGAGGEKEWRRGKGGNVGQNRPGGHAHQYHPKTTTTSGRGSGPRTLPVPKSGSVGSKPSRTAFGSTGGAKQSVNGVSGSKPGGGTDGSLRRPHGSARPGGSGPGSGLRSRPGSGSGPGSRSGSPLQKKPPAGRCRSSDSLDPAPSVRLAESDRVRSLSLTQVRRLPSPPTLAPSSSSSSSSVARHPAGAGCYSINRAASCGPAPPTGGPAPEGGGVKVQSSAERSGVGVPPPLPASALKKPLLSGLGPAFKPSGISYRLSRPSLVKQSRPLRVTTANGTAGEQEVKRGPATATPSTAESSPESSPERKGLAEGEVWITAGSLEDMSLSSGSSLDGSDSSQEFMDDFDDLGNGGAGLLLLAKNHEDDSGLDQSRAGFDEDEAAAGEAAAALCFLDDGVDWTAMAGERGQHRLTRDPHQRRSSQVDDHEQGGSSLDLSPSDSCGSGGTYMWDEEGLQPLGGATTTTASISTTVTNGNTTHHIGSFDSDLNSIDVLNNLDSCDLDDDDLMLDEDLPEDASLHSEGDGVAPMAQWRMRQLCWGTQDVHTDTDSDFQGFHLAEDSGNRRTDGSGDNDLILDFCPPRSPGSPGLGLDVEELAGDCCAVRSQLEYLQGLLLQEEDEDSLTTDTLSPETTDSSSTQDLLQEVQQLREELRSRDRTIALLSLQLAVPTATTGCRCQETTDRHTQTSLTERESTSQVFHASSRDDQEPVTLQAPPPADPCSASSRPRLPADGFPARVTEGARKEEAGGRKETRRVPHRFLQPPQPSKLRLFTPQTRRLPRDPESSEVKVKMAAFTSGLSRLPKPKSHGAAGRPASLNADPEV